MTLTTATTLRAVIYARLSSDPKKQGKSVADQITEGKADCAANGWQLVRVFADNDRGASRHSKKNRPEYTKLIEYMQAGHADVLITREASRAQRDLEVYVELRKVCASAGVLWAYKGRIFDLNRTDDRFQTGLDALLSEREADEIKDRVMRGKRHTADAGLPAGRLLFGYQREYDPHTKAFLRQVIREDQAAIIREAARRYASGETVRTIRLDFNRRELMTATGKTWSDASLRKMITNPAYIGKLVHQGRILRDGVWPKILRTSVFYACVRRAEEARLGHQRDNEPRHLLTGIAVCGVCGSRLRRIPPSSRSTKSDYGCGGTPTAPGGCVTIRMERLDGYVTELLLARLGRPDAVGTLDDDLDDETESLLSAANDLRARLEEFYVAAARGQLSPAALARVEAELMPQLEAAERSAREALVPPVLADAVRPDIAAVWPTLPIAQQREIVRALMAITLNPAEVKGHVAFDHRRVAVTWKHDL